ncbi:hypothetical protein RND81_08G213400 [Saponaria officinalis]|uniref:Legume lectin domain-containing protein n=1 Tax=Saponaria officinalis TaxID=3572 RepID=A0AAW1JAA2_SAPOF
MVELISITTMNQIQRYYLLSISLIFNFIITLIAEPNSSFSLQSFNGDKNPNFDSNFTLLGNAKITNEGNFVNLTSNSSGLNSGQIVYKKPFKFLDSISFSTEFTFTITPGDGDGIAFVIFPQIDDISRVFGQGYFGLSDKFDKKIVAVEYDTRKDANHVGVDLGNFVSTEISNVSSIGLILNAGVLLKSWIDYESGSKRLNIRLSDSRSEKPSTPLISYPVDLSKMWENTDVLVGITSLSSNSTQISSISSWSFVVTTGSSTLHSEPLSPENKVGKDGFVPRKTSCFLTVLGGVIFATGCGTMVAFLALFVWVIFFGRHSNVVPELGMSPVDFKYEKVNVTVDNVGDDESTRLSTT